MCIHSNYLTKNKEGWKSTTAFDYYELLFTAEGDDGTTKYGRSVVIPIGTNKKVISIHAIYEDKEFLSDVDIILQSLSF